MKLQKIKEGKVNLWIPIEKLYNQPVFYNTVAELTRDISISALQVFQKQSKLKIDGCDALSATGVRGLRYTKEVSGVKSMTLVDKNPIAVKLIRKNIKENKLSKCKVLKKDANVILHQNIFNFIDLDPFGSPNIYLPAAAKSIYHKGFLAVTATDQAPLCGVFPEKCLKKYGISSIKTEYYNELGLRVLISSIILSLARYDRAFIPVLSFSINHYYRVFGRIEGTGRLTKLIKEFKYVNHCCNCFNREFDKIKDKCNCKSDFSHCGPIYLGSIQDSKFVKSVLNDLKTRNFRLSKEETKLLKIISSEIDTPFYFDLHRLAKKGFKLEKIDKTIDRLKKKGFKASRTHFCDTAVKTDTNLKEISG